MVSKDQPANWLALSVNFLKLNVCTSKDSSCTAVHMAVPMFSLVLTLHASLSRVNPSATIGTNVYPTTSGAEKIVITTPYVRLKSVSVPFFDLFLCS